MSGVRVIVCGGRDYGTLPGESQRLRATLDDLHRRQMLAEFDPGLIVAFPGGRGTADMVRRARVHSVPVVEVEAEQ